MGLLNVLLDGLEKREKEVGREKIVMMKVEEEEEGRTIDRISHKFQYFYENHKLS